MSDAEFGIEQRWLEASPVLAGFQRDPVRCLRKVNERFGPSVVFRRLTRRDGRCLLVTTDPALIRPVFSSPVFRNTGLALRGPEGSAQRRIRRSLFRLHGEEHRRHRRLIAPALAKRAVAGHRDTIIALTEAMLDGWRVGEERDLARELRELARNVAAAALFGQSDLATTDAIGPMIEDWFRQNFRLATRRLRRDWPGLPYRELLHRAARLERLVLEMIQRRRDEGLAGTDLLSRLVRARDEQGGLSEAELVGEIHILFLAAHETTASAMTWTLFLLAQHPPVAARVFAELESGLGGKPPTLDQLEWLPLLDRVIQESLRLVPLVPYGARVAVEPVTIGPLELARGSRVLVPYDVLHRRPDVFPDPYRFDPDRWLSLTPPPYTYLPFSSGLHGCAGSEFAWLELRLVLATLLQRFGLRVRPGARVDYRVTATLTPRRGLPVRLAPADGRFERVPVRGGVHRLVDLDSTAVGRRRPETAPAARSHSR